MGQPAAAILHETFFKSVDPRLRARAMFCGAALVSKSGQQPFVAEMVKRTLKESNPDLRVLAIRLARLHGVDLWAIAPAAKDSAPEVRRELAIALRHNKSPAAAGLWADLAMQFDGQDRWYLEALGIAADQQWDSFLDAYLAKTSEPWKTLAGRGILWRSRAKQTPALLVKIIKDPATKEDEHPRYFRALDFLAGPEKEAALKSLLE
jgi:hypothetical protein